MRQDDAISREIYLRPGEIYIGEVASRVTTVLGSCISVTLFHQKTGIGAICHALMPANNGKGSSGDGRNHNARFVDSAIREMLSGMMRTIRSGIRPVDMEVKLFGGAAMVIGSREKMREASVGYQNVASARRVLEAAGLKIAASDVGGTRGRKIIFFTHTGEVLLKRLNPHEISDQVCGIGAKLDPIQPMNRRKTGARK